MFGRGGNRIALDNTGLSYSNFLPADFAEGDGAARYMTAKLDGLFMLSAQLEGISEFAISGPIGTSGSAEIKVSEFVIDVGGVNWAGFVKRVLNPNTPSVQHLILVPEVEGLVHTFDESPISDGDTLSGLPASTPLHYFLYSREMGGDYDDSIVREFARTYLESLLPGPRWCRPVPATGNTAGGSRSTVELQIDAATLPAGSHTTRFAVVPTEAAPDSELINWSSLSVDVAAPGFTTSAESINFTSLVGFSPEMIELEVTSGGEAPMVESSAPWLEVTDAGGGLWQIVANVAELPAAIYGAHLTIRDGISIKTIPVSLVVEGRHYRLLRMDPARARLYCLSGIGTGPGFVVIYDTTTQTLIDAIPVGREPTDFDLNEDASEMVVLNNTDASISRIDLETLLVTETVQLPDFTVSPFPFDGRIADGPGSIVYYTDEQTGPRLRVFDMDSKTVLQNLSADLTPPDDPEDSFGFGDIVVSPERDRMFGWSRNGHSGNPQDVHVIKFSIDENGTLSNFDRSTPRDRTWFRRDPEETPALLSEDGRRLFIKDSQIYTEDIQVELLTYSDSAFSISPGGELVGLRSRIMRLDDRSFTEVPGSEPNAFTPDYAWFTSIGTDGEIIWTDLSTIATPSELGLGFAPDDGGGVLATGDLQWPPVTNVRQFEVYLGTDPAVVAAASPSSPEFLGVSSGTKMKLPADLEQGRPYYWQVRPVGLSEAPFEIVRSFSVFPLTPSAESIQSITVSGVSQQRERLVIDAAADTAWSVTADVPWLTIEPASGTGPAELSLVIDASELAEENHFAEVDSYRRGD